MEKSNQVNHTYKDWLLRLSLVASLFFTTFSVYAQEDPYLKNSLYLSYGILPATSQVSFSYERLLFAKKKFRTKAKINYGKYLSNHADFEDGAKVYDNFQSISIVQLIDFFELNLGVAHTEFSFAENITGRSPKMNALGFYGSAGIRYEKKNFVLRSGIGNLSLLYLGIGVNF